MLHLQPMTAAKFEDFKNISIPRYAEEMVKTGQWQPENAIEKCRKLFYDILPAGKDTEGHTFLTIADDVGGEDSIGHIWYEIRTGDFAEAFIWELSIALQHRRKGYATRTLIALEQTLRALGCEAIVLHVFPHNKAAKGLYRKNGFEYKEQNQMRKNI